MVKLSTKTAIEVSISFMAMIFAYVLSFKINFLHFLKG